jgi:sugar lactone lactonase YvrE
MRHARLVIPFLILLGALPAFGVSHYTILFTATSGSPTATGSFDYDPSTQTFSSFTILWDGVTLDLTGAANHAGVTDFGIFTPGAPVAPACLGMQNGAAAAFLLLTQCTGEWSANDVTIIGPITFAIELAGPGFPWISLNVGFFPGVGTIESGARGTYRIQAAVAEPVYIADSQNNRIRMVNTSGTIGTVAGNGTQGFSGDGSAATGAEVHSPFGIAVDSYGNLYIADAPNNRVRMVNTSGAISTIAGNGLAAYSGDGGPAIFAGLNNPTGVAVDSSGDVFIADERNNRIRKIDPSGTISTVTGNGIVGNSGDGGPATSARLYYPTGIAVDGFGDLYIADSNNQRVRKVDGSGVITTVAGTGTVGYNCNNGTATGVGLHTPYGVAVDGSGNLYIADYGNQCIRKVDASGNITTVAGNGTASYGGDFGPAISAELNYPTGVAVDSSGNLFIADYVNNRIRVVDTSGVITTIAGKGTAGYSGDGGPSSSAELYQPTGVAVAAPAAVSAATCLPVVRGGCSRRRTRTVLLAGPKRTPHSS